MIEIELKKISEFVTLNISDGHFERESKYSAKCRILAPNTTGIKPIVSQKKTDVY